jgi:uracil-DNA glycosylase
LLLGRSRNRPAWRCSGQRSQASVSLHSVGAGAPDVFDPDSRKLSRGGDVGAHSIAPELAGTSGPPTGLAADQAFGRLLTEIGGCTICTPYLPLGPRPVLRGRPSARLLIISQAPGRRVHETGLSFNDRSGDRLRAWLALDRETFYDETRVAILGMALCYPGRDAKGGDLPPRPECAPRWHASFRAFLPAIGLTLLVGSYAIDYYLPSTRKRSMTEAIMRWRDFLPQFFVLPHPSWRSTLWLREHPWFENEVLPEMRERIAEVVSPSAPGI